MIIANRAATTSFGTDPVAQSVRSFITPSARLSAASAEREVRSALRSADLARLYPSLCLVEGRASARSHAARAAAAALTAAGTMAAAFLAIVHK